MAPGEQLLFEQKEISFCEHQKHSPSIKANLFNNIHKTQGFREIDNAGKKSHRSLIFDRPSLNDREFDEQKKSESV